MYATRGSILERLNRVHFPAIYPWAEIAEEGGFLGYGARLRVYFRQKARLVSRILSGARPQNLPIEQPDRYDLAVNRKTAQTLGSARRLHRRKHVADTISKAIAERTGATRSPIVEEISVVPVENSDSDLLMM